MIKRSLPVEELCDRLRPIFGNKIDQLYFQYTVAGSKEEKEDILHIINALYLKNLNQLLDRGVLLEPPQKKDVEGEYTIGMVHYAGTNLHPFGLREKDWKRHLCATGMSGSGKTTLAFHIAQQMNNHNKPFLIFDWKKSFRPLMSINSELIILTIGDKRITNNFKTNINKPPKGVAPKEWINVLTDLLVESFFASYGVHKVLLETLDEAFEEWNIYEGSENYPTWKHIKWRLEEKYNKADGRESGWIESALRIATVLTFGDFGEVVNYKGTENIAIEELLDKKVIMELNALGNVEKKFFCEYLLTYIYKLKKARQNEPEKPFDHAIIVDEAHNIFLKKTTNFANESVTDMVYREMREYGTSLICLDQHISKISDTVKGNSACTIAFQQQLPEDLEDISKLMQLWETKHYFSQLQVGEAIVKLAERHTSPFLIKIPDTSIREKNYSDKQLITRVKAVLQQKKLAQDKEFKEQLTQTQEEEHKTKKEEQDEIKKLLLDYTKEQLKQGITIQEIKTTLENNKKTGGYTNKLIEEIIKDTEKEQKKTLKRKKTLEKTGLNEPERAFIEYLQEHPNHKLSTVELYKQIGLSARKGTVTKKSLEQKGLLKIEEERNEKGWKKHIRLQE